MSRVLIVNADDFGLCRGVNRAVVHTFEHGIVTSASLMVHGAAAAEAGEYARAHPALSVGLHLDLAEWSYAEDEWRCRYERVDTADAAAVRDELARQIDMLTALTGRPPTHLDSHQHAHRSEPVQAAMIDAGAWLGVPVRDVTAGVRYRGDYYGQTGKGEPYTQALTVTALCAVIAQVGRDPEPAVELGCHPGYIDDLDSVYALEREVEARVLCEPAVRAAVAAAGVQLAGFDRAFPKAQH